MRSNCPESIRTINIADLGGKTIVVDTSIYLYKFESENMLLENMYLMLSIFRYYNIIPLFIFDGKPPPEKDALINNRKLEKDIARNEYTDLSNTLKNNEDISESNKQDLLSQLDKLKKQFVTLNKNKIDSVKELITAYGASYYEAEGESDTLCVNLVIKKKAWACLSEDMDLFVYGCPRVLRYFSLMSHTAILYSMKGILTELNQTHNEFKSICILCGTDYSFNTDGGSSDIDLLRAFKLFGKYKIEKSKMSFYGWLENNSGFVLDTTLAKNIGQMFCLVDTDVRALRDIRAINIPIDDDKIQEIMEPEGFMFVN